jgi:N-acetyl-anhydromuramyl-L-alanine amidase AmpD
MSRKVNATYTSDQVKNAFKVRRWAFREIACARSSQWTHFLFRGGHQVFENGSSQGSIKVDDLLNALTNYGSTKLTVDQAQELISQVIRAFFFSFRHSLWYGAFSIA